MKPIHIEAKSISDAWFQLIYNLPDFGYRQDIQRGSFAKEQTRLQYPGISVYIEYPHKDVVPIMPAGMGIPSPTTVEYINDYFLNYLMRGILEKHEQYTYGERIQLSIDQIIRILKETPQTNQAVIEIGRPEDIGLEDPPCLRVLDFKVLPDNVLSISVYFRSWDLWSGFPSNLGGIEMLKQYVAQESDRVNGPMYAYSSGLHLYGFHEEVAKIRTMRDW